MDYKYLQINPKNGKDSLIPVKNGKFYKNPKIQDFKNLQKN